MIVYIGEGLYEINIGELQKTVISVHTIQRFLEEISFINEIYENNTNVMKLLEDEYEVGYKAGYQEASHFMDEACEKNIYVIKLLEDKYKAGYQQGYQEASHLSGIESNIFNDGYEEGYIDGCLSAKKKR